MKARKDERLTDRFRGEGVTNPLPQKHYLNSIKINEGVNSGEVEKVDFFTIFGDMDDKEAFLVAKGNTLMI